MQFASMNTDRAPKAQPKVPTDLPPGVDVVIREGKPVYTGMRAGVRFWGDLHAVTTTLEA